MRDALWLARWEVARTWPSYAWTFLAMSFGGFLAWTVLAGGSNEAGYFHVLGFFFVAMGTTLGTNFGSRDCWIGVRTAFPDRLFFFRSLPISAGQVVVGRALARIPPMLVNTVALFLPSYVIEAFVGDGLADLFEPGAYFWFALIWVAYAVPWLALQFYGELGLHGRDYNIATFVALPILVVVTLAFPLAFEVPIVASVIALANTYGPVASVIALAVGFAVSVPIFALVARRVARRDLVT